MITFNHGIMYAKAVCDFMNNTEAFNEYDIIAKTFCNGRENGFCLVIWGGEKQAFKDFFIWIHEHRNSDACVVRWGNADDYDIDNNMYSENTYNNKTEEFREFNPVQVCKFILQKIEEFYKGEAVKNG